MGERDRERERERERERGREGEREREREGEVKKGEIKRERENVLFVWHVCSPYKSILIKETNTICILNSTYA